jgi:hypothetical protein
MKTTIVYQYYNFETHEHKGTHPNIYFETEQVPLNGCTGVSASIRLYPNGNNSNRKNASIFTVFYCEDSKVSLRLKYSIAIIPHSDKLYPVTPDKPITGGNEGYVVSVGGGGHSMVQFGQEFGYPGLCDIRIVHQQLLQLKNTLEVLEYKRGDNVIVAQECVYTLTSPPK